MEEIENLWVRCNSCKAPILFGAKYWVCNVSTCNRKRTGLRFCSVTCWDAHQPMMNHRESWAEEREAPTRQEWARILEEESAPKKRRPRGEADASVAPEPVLPKPVVSAPKPILRRTPRE